MTSNVRHWIVDLVAGAVVGGVVGAIVAVNVVIYTGIEGGYEATIPQVFQENAVIGLVTVAILGSGPILGVFVARWLRRRAS